MARQLNLVKIYIELKNISKLEERKTYSELHTTVIKNFSKFSIFEFLIAKFLELLELYYEKKNIYLPL